MWMNEKSWKTLNKPADAIFPVFFLQQWRTFAQVNPEFIFEVVSWRPPSFWWSAMLALHLRAVEFLLCFAVGYMWSSLVSHVYLYTEGVVLGIAWSMLTYCVNDLEGYAAGQRSCRQISISPKCWATALFNDTKQRFCLLSAFWLHFYPHRFLVFTYTLTNITTGSFSSYMSSSELFVSFC